VSCSWRKEFMSMVKSRQMNRDGPQIVREASPSLMSQGASFEAEEM
jgi:hypothetical protein